MICSVKSSVHSVSVNSESPTQQIICVETSATVLAILSRFFIFAPSGSNSINNDHLQQNKDRYHQIHDKYQQRYQQVNRICG